MLLVRASLLARDPCRGNDQTPAVGDGKLVKVARGVAIPWIGFTAETQRKSFFISLRLGGEYLVAARRPAFWMFSMGTDDGELN